MCYRKLLLSVFLPAFVAMARAESIDACYRNAATRHNVDATLLWSIAMAETGGNNNAIGRNYSKVREPAKRVVLSEDLGTMQVNSGWLPKLRQYGITREKLLADRCLNIDVGAWILANSIKRYGATWNAVGAYNAGCSSLSKEECDQARERYTRKVWGWYARLNSRDAMDSSVPPDSQSTQITRAHIYVAEETN